MALDHTRLSNNIFQKIRTTFHPHGQTIPDDNNIGMKKMCDAIAAAVIEELTTYATISTVVTGSSASGGPVVGTGTGSPPGSIS